MLQLTDLAKAYGGQELFCDLTWRINPGDCWGLVGPNGVGKTTLLRILAKEETADQGQVASPKGWRIGYLPQEVRRAGTGSVLDETCAAVPEAGRIEARMRRVEEAMADASPDSVEQLTRRYAALQDQFQSLDGFSVSARAKEILSGLGFPANALGRPVDELSGGWAMRVALAGLLLSRPDVLLLDEPTNHLDLESLEWLEAFLGEYRGAWVVVSHDRYFLNRMVDGIAELNRGGVDTYVGNYDHYLAQRAFRREQQVRTAAGQARRVAELERFIERFRAKNTKARQVQSRVKMLERMERVELPDAGRRSLNIRLPEPGRSGRDTIRLDDIRKAYPRAHGGENVVYRSLGFTAERGERVALVGVNGAGKSTLLKLLAGVTDFQAGSRTLGYKVSLHYYAQHQMDALHPRNSVVDELRAVMADASETRVRGLAGAFLFTGEEADKKVTVLSGGEKARVALAKMLARPANLLLLDEPTNHLDLDSREVLEAALLGFAGTIVFVSHDRYFINRIATRVVEVRVGGVVESFPGDYDYWQWKRAELLAADQPSAETAQRVARGKPKQERSGLSKNARRKIEEAIEALEAEIESGEARMAEIDSDLGDPAVFSEADRVQRLSRERGEVERAVEAALAAWEERSQELEAASE